MSFTFKKFNSLTIVSEINFSKNNTKQINEASDTVIKQLKRYLSGLNHTWNQNMERLMIMSWILKIHENPTSSNTKPVRDDIAAIYFNILQWKRQVIHKKQILLSKPTRLFKMFYTF